VKADEGWTEPVKRDKTATPQQYQHPNSVRLDRIGKCIFRSPEVLVTQS
jgi:hypothetical protein